MREDIRGTVKGNILTCSLIMLTVMKGTQTLLMSLTVWWFEGFRFSFR